MTNAIPPRDRDEITRILRAALASRHDWRLRLFGSRARGDARQVSDIDLALETSPALPAAEWSLLRERLEDSTVPFRIDLIDYANAPAPLRQAIDREGVAWLSIS